jgi:hypothetical protein
MKQVEMVSTHIRRQMVTPIKGFFGYIYVQIVEKEIIAKKQGGGGGVGKKLKKKM